MSALTILHTPEQALAWLRERVTGTLRLDSRQVTPGDGFFAWPGAAHDARAFLAAAIARGATACLAEPEGFDPGSVDAYVLQRVAFYPGLKAAGGYLASSWWGQPSSSMPVAAVTGTNGKTSVAWWVAHAMQQLGRKCGLVGTLGVGIPPDVQATGMTSPDPLTLQSSMAAMHAQGASACVMEASSIGLEEGRLNGTQIRVAAFTNFTQDHLDYHGSMDAYWQSKQALFDWPGLHTAVVNVDDKHGARLAAQLQQRWASEAADTSRKVIACRMEPLNATAPAQSANGRLSQRSSSQNPGEAAWQHELEARSIRFDEVGVAFELVERSGLEEYARTQAVSVHAPVTGLFNVANLLVVAGILRGLGMALPAVAAALGQLPLPPGRMQLAGGQGVPLVAVDYAHTPDALRAALQALRPVAQQRGGALLCLFGCGGDRDATKRPLMAQAAAHAADAVWVTSDNPRSEQPQAIIEQVLAGVSAADLPRVCSVLDRREAIARAIAHAQPADVVLVAGKGHENYQEVQGVKHHFCDMQEVQQALAQRKEAASCA